jgi:hypothetical protein
VLARGSGTCQNANRIYPHKLRNENNHLARSLFNLENNLVFYQNRVVRFAADKFRRTYLGILEIPVPTFYGLISQEVRKRS